MKISAVKSYKNNNKTHRQDQIEEVKKSILLFGFNQPILLNKDNVIIVGHARFEAVKQLGWDEMVEASRVPKGIKKIPYAYIEELSQEDIDRYRISDNFTNAGEVNYENLKLELKRLGNVAGIDEAEFVRLTTLEAGELKKIEDISNNEFGEYTDDLIKNNGKADVLPPVESGNVEGIRYPVIFWFETEAEANQIKEVFKKDEGSGSDSEKLKQLVGV